jgi:hypothetical protein
MLNKLGTFIKKKGLPLLGSVLGGPAAVAGQVVSMVAGELGLETDNEDEIIKHIESNPDTVLALKKLEADTKVELRKLSLQATELQIKQDQAYLDDRSDARSREESFIERTGGRDWSMTALAWTITAGFLGAVYALIFAVVPSSEVLLLLLGTLGSSFIAIVSYYFGSSKGSSDKNSMLQQNEAPSPKEEKKGGLG